MKPQRSTFYFVYAPLLLALLAAGLAATAQPDFSIGLGASLGGVLVLWLCVLLLARRGT